MRFKKKDISIRDIDAEANEETLSELTDNKGEEEEEE